MKQQPLSNYLARLKTAVEKKAWTKVKQYGEFAVKKLPLLDHSPREEYQLYNNLGLACLNLTEYSRSLDYHYKSNLIAVKHSFHPPEIAYTSLMLGLNFLSLRDVNHTIAQMRKVEQYYRQYGYDCPPMAKADYILALTALAYCYLYQNNLTLARDIIEEKLNAHLPDLSSGFPLLNYHHLKGEYLLTTKEYPQAAQSFRECIRLSEEIQFPRGIYEAQIHLAVIDLLEGRLEASAQTLDDVLKNTTRLKLNDLICEAALLLSKYYVLTNRPAKAAAIEKRIKPILGKLDAVWLYEKTREFEQLFRRLSTAPQGVYREEQGEARIPRVLTDTLNRHYEASPARNIIIGSSHLMHEVYQLIEKIAPTDLPVLIQGETGTGKELIAQALHQHSSREGKPLLAFNCAAFPETMIESELFGHTKGAFTGADEAKKGDIELASEGTLFLDELANMSPAMQQKLLRVLEEKQVWPLGAQQAVKINTRFIFASNQNIEEQVKLKLFREDLFYRINTITINLPPLRDRPDDIPLLIQHFLGKYSPKTHNAQPITPDALRLLSAYPWVGNVRELQNEMKRLCVLYPKAQVIGEEMLSESIRKYSLSAVTTNEPVTLKELTDDFQRNVIRETLAKCGDNLAQAARQLGYDRANLYRKMKQLKI